MEQLPVVEPGFSHITDILYGTIKTHLLITSVEMKVFDHLEQPRTAREMAGILTSHPANTGMMLDSLCACGLVAKKDGQYINLKSTSDCLVSWKPAYIGTWIEQADGLTTPNLSTFMDRIMLGPGNPSHDEHMNSEEYCEAFTHSHAATSFAGIAHDIARSLAEIPGFDRCRTMMDLGGGPGVNAMAVVRAHGNIKAVVYDRPGIAAIARGYIEKYGFGDSVTTAEGDYLQCLPGKGYDLIMVTDSLYYEDDEVDAVIARCHEALNDDGIFVGIHAVLTHEKTMPANLVLDMLIESLNGNAALPESGFIARSMQRCGFCDVTSKMVDIAGIDMEMNTGRRAK